jgi:hypothetical protein
MATNKNFRLRNECKELQQLDPLPEDPAQVKLSLTLMREKDEGVIVFEIVRSLCHAQNTFLADVSVFPGIVAPSSSALRARLASVATPVADEHKGDRKSGGAAGAGAAADAKADAKADEHGEATEYAEDGVEQSNAMQVRH